MNSPESTLLVTGCGFPNPFAAVSVTVAVNTLAQSAPVNVTSTAVLVNK